MLLIIGAYYKNTIHYLDYVVSCRTFLHNGFNSNVMNISSNNKFVMFLKDCTTIYIAETKGNETNVSSAVIVKLYRVDSTLWSYRILEWHIYSHQIHYKNREFGFLSFQKYSV